MTVWCFRGDEALTFKVGKCIDKISVCVVGMRPITADISGNGGRKKVKEIMFPISVTIQALRQFFFTRSSCAWRERSVGMGCVFLFVSIIEL